MYFRFRILLCIWVVAKSFAADFDLWIESADDPAEAQLFINEWREHPLDIHNATIAELAALPYFDTFIGQRFIEWRLTSGEIHSLSDLKRCPFLTDDQRSSLKEFTQLPERDVPTKIVAKSSAQFKTRSDDFQDDDGRISYRVTDQGGLNAFLWARRTPDRADYFGQFAGGVESNYFGHSLRLLLGDYQLDFGTGLISAGGWGAASWITDRERLTPQLGTGLKLRGNSNRLHGLRGGAAEFSRAHFRGALIASENKLNAALDDENIATITEQAQSSVELDRARADQITMRSAGATSTFSTEKFTLAGLVLGRDFSHNITSGLREDRFDQIVQTSVAGTYVLGDLSFTGEAARNDAHGTAINAAASVGQSALGATGYWSFSDENFFGLTGSAWGGFGEQPGNLERVGVRATAASSFGQFFVHTFFEQRLASSDDRELSRPRESVEVVHRLSVENAGRFETLIGRTSRENVLETVSETIHLDRLRVSWEDRALIPLKIRAEWRQAGPSGGDSKIGSYLSLHYLPSVRSFNFVISATGFSLEDDLVSTSIYERTIGDEFPLVTLSGVGARGMLAVMQEFGPVRLAGKIAYQHRNLRGDELRTTEVAIALSFKQSSFRPS